MFDHSNESYSIIKKLILGADLSSDIVDSIIWSTLDSVQV